MLKNGIDSIFGFFGGLGGGKWTFEGGDGSNPSVWKHEPDGNKELATFGAGCYWGTEKFYATEFAERYPGAILGTSVGFMNPDPNAPPSPTYMQVCTRETGYVEVAHILFDSSKVNYRELVRFFYTFHDPTTLNRQGNDTGTQYASVIFCHSPKQREVAKEIQMEVDKNIANGKIKTYIGPKVVTQVHDANPYYAAQRDHQRYLENNPLGYCNHTKYFKWEDVE